MKIISRLLLVLFMFLFIQSFNLAQIPSATKNASVFISDLDGHVPQYVTEAQYQVIDALTGVTAFPVYPGFPVSSNYAVFSPKTGAIFCNMDSDAELEIVFGSGTKLFAINLDTTSVPGWPKVFAANYEVQWTPSFGDIDGDGIGEVVITAGGVPGGNIHAYHTNGTIVTGFPVSVGRYPMSATLCDLDNNGTKEIIMGTRTGQVVVYNGNGTMYTGWPKQMDRYVGASAAAGDVNNDGIPEIAIESRNLLYLYDRNGNILPGFPFAILDSLVGSNSYSAPVLVDMDNDNQKEIVFCSHSDVTNAGGIVYVVKNDGTNYPGWPKTVPNWIYAAPIVADISGDGELDVIITEYGSSPTPAFYIYGYNKNGTMLNNFPIGPLYGQANQITIADIDNDMRFELIADQNVQVGDLGRYEAFNHDGTVLSGWPIEFSKNSSFQQPLLTDMNNDGILDIIGGSFEFGGGTSTNLYAWNTGLTYFPNRIVNPVYQFNAAHDGVYNGNGVIPVELISYNAVVNYNDVTLRWSTSTELNNSHFEIFRNDELIVVIDGNGTTTTQSDYFYVDENLPTGSYSYTLVQIDFDGTKKNLGTIELSLNEIPKEFSLSQNYPNPFNPVTKISYSISDFNSLVQLKVFDVLGNEVATLVNEVQPAGTYEIEFSAAGDNATGLSSGIYFYKLNSGKFSEIKKMILLK